jgi:hypothetical protein
MMATAEATLRREETERSDAPLRTFEAGQGRDLQLEVYADRLEIRAPRRIVALWHRYVERCLPWREDGRDVLAIVDRGGQVLMIPMRRSDIGAAVRVMRPLLS